MRLRAPSRTAVRGRMPRSGKGPIVPRVTKSEGADTEKGPASGRVLLVHDDEATCEVMEVALRRNNLDVTGRRSGDDALDLVAEQDFDVVLTDISMSKMSGMDLCERMLALRPDLPVIVVTGHASFEAAVAAIRAGAYDFVVQPVDAKVLALTVSRAIQHRRLRDELKLLRRVVGGEPRLGEMIGASPTMKTVFDLVDRVAASEASVLITGESGTGKELIARAVHDRSPRRDGPFVAVNCAALLESELFGHAKGAFTDAKNARTGLFMQATGGTLFLDEIGELPIELQPKLLRALQERTVRPVGGNADLPFVVRVVTATNRDLDTEVAHERFRQDLYYRINVVSVHAPALRERGADVLLLAQHFVDRFAARGAPRPWNHHAGRREARRLILARQRPRAPEGGGGGRRAPPHRRGDRGRPPGEDPEAHRRPPRRRGGRRRQRREAARAREALRDARPRARRRQQVARGGSAGRRSPHAVPKAGAV